MLISALLIVFASCGNEGDAEINGGEIKEDTPSNLIQLKSTDLRAFFLLLMLKKF